MNSYFLLRINHTALKGKINMIITQCNAIVPSEGKCMRRYSISHYCEDNSKNSANYLYHNPEIIYNCGLPAQNNLSMSQKTPCLKKNNTKANHFPFQGLLKPLAAEKLIPRVLQV